MRLWALVISLAVGGLSGALAWFVNELDLRTSFYLWTGAGAALGVIFWGLALRRYRT